MHVLITAAHPDDVDFSCGGTVRSLANGGAAITLVVATSGDAGVPDGAEGASLREREQEAAAKILGIEAVRFLRLPDGDVEPTRQLRRRLTSAIRLCRPGLVITHTPTRNLRSVRSSHRDHLAVGQATLEAVYPDARNGLAHPRLLEQGLAPHTVPEVWLHGTDTPDFTVDITTTFDSKMRAVNCHASQKAAVGDSPEEFFREWGAGVAARHGLPRGRLAEEFMRLDTR
ncbi:PIG-L deacetylase family protein [Streptomyces sp. ALI-76-A]|uniref:PIG-L deacetylase family protein n=1 Tax=Streptomyces sp. ALI-76-A TaxID=3025736 RepID=UPI00256F610A|nr:PIG-L deacetylase family protein [Streptomyces sp. ALI-76-A]MDL5199804.1 PIG-L deacetylase family protein [Streptomyces sp. ALI-76-A]